MKRKANLKFLTPAIALAVLGLTTAKASVIAQWTFENTANTNGLTFAPGANTSPGTVLADNGLNSSVSTASGLHANAATYSTPAGDLDPTIAGLDPGASAANASPSSHSFSSTAWSVGDYYSFTTSTLGFTGIEVAFDQAGSNTGPRDFALQYSINGGGFTQFTTYQAGFSGNWNTTTAQPASLLFAGNGAFDNDSSITFRLVDLDTTSVNGSSVAAGGTDRVDNFTIVAVPEPATWGAISALGLLGICGLREWRQKKQGQAA
jgi:hypothetical protein